MAASGVRGCRLGDVVASEGCCGWTEIINCKWDGVEAKVTSWFHLLKEGWLVCRWLGHVRVLVVSRGWSMQVEAWSMVIVSGGAWFSRNKVITSVWVSTNLAVIDRLRLLDINVYFLLQNILFLHHVQSQNLFTSFNFQIFKHRKDAAKIGKLCLIRDHQSKKSSICLTSVFKMGVWVSAL